MIKGQSLVEYVLIMALVCGVCVCCFCNAIHSINHVVERVNKAYEVRV